MTFAEFRSLLRHINEQHSPRRNGIGKKVVYVESTTDMRTGEVNLVRLRGHGWEKGFYGSGDGSTLLKRCMDYLDNNAGADGADRQEEGQRRAIDVLVDILTGEFGQQCAELGVGAGAENLEFKIPVSVLQKAIEEKKDGNRGGIPDTDAKDSDTGKCP